MNPAFDHIVDQISSVILGKPDQIRLALACLFAKGHLLIEDLPGIGKTTLAKALSRCLGLNFRRVQFTSDMLPGDILGISVFERKSSTFVFHPGPIFTQVLLADEINRATPKTQSALLEAMEEKQVTVEGETRLLEPPFFVIATQNPLDLAGTYPLPDSQLDRFLLRTAIGYPSAAEERRLLIEPDRRRLLEDLAPELDSRRVLALVDRAAGLHVAEPVLDYIQALVEATRTHAGLRAGLSPRAALALIRTARAHALVRRQDFCLPENVKQIFPYLAGHRLQPLPESGLDSRGIVEEIVDNTAVP